MAKKLDRERDFGTICGGGEVAYVQDNVYFDALGNEIVTKAATGKKKAADPAPVADTVDQSPTNPDEDFQE